MKVSLKWLQDYVRVDVPTGKLVELLDLSGTKVEAVNRPGAGLEGIEVAEVLNIVDHPNADNLTLVDVRAQDGEQRVVCGARNFAVGDKVPYARVGARLSDLEISERKIRGEVSRGMLCSAAEMGVSKDHSGILVLPGDIDIGADVVAVLGLNDTILELEITPNRPDCMGMIGIAREVAALLGNDLVMPEPSQETAGSGEGELRVTLEDPEGCPRYVAHLIGGVTVGPSIGWMAPRLLAAGIRPINNVVDATNYVLIETGHPLHAFDAARVASHHVVVRRARRGERLVTLDGIERELHPEDLLIADPAKPLALAGVMGGEDSEVGPETTAVILESAYFDAATIGRSSRRSGLRTEASARFERGMDPDVLPFAAARCADVIRDTAGAMPSTRMVDEYPVPIPSRRVTLRPERTSRLLGYDLSREAQATHLRSIALEVSERDGVLEVEVPRFRPDIEREVDLIEEVARLAGFDRLPSSLPHGGAGGLESLQAAERALRRQLAATGLHEAWTTSLGTAADHDRLGLAADHHARAMVALANPMSEHEDKMRTSILPGLLRSVARNVARQVEDVALFEIARLFEPSGGKLPLEPLVLGAVFTGRWSEQSWRGEAITWDFFRAKGVLEAALAALGVDVSLSPLSRMPYHPTRAALLSVAGRPAGSIGEIHPHVCRSFDVPEGSVAFEIALAPVFDALPGRIGITELPKYPPVLLDMAVVVDEAVPAADVERVIVSAGQEELESVRLFDLYRGEQVPAGKKSLAYSLLLRAPDRTLTDEEASGARSRIVSALSDALGAELRS